MYLKIDENDFGGYYYDRFLVINGVEKQFTEKEYELLFEEDLKEEELEVVVIFQNRFLSSNNKGRVIDCLIDWVERFLNGGRRYGVEAKMCKPYDAMLEFTCKNTDRIELYTNSFTMDKPFVFYRRSPKVHKNLFYADADYKKRWMLSQMLPLGILYGILLTVFIAIFIAEDLAGKILSGLLLTMLNAYFIGYCVYIRHLLRRH